MHCPVQGDESTNDIIMKVGEIIGVDVNKDDISISHRLSTTKPSQRDTLYTDPAIIVKFVKRDTRDSYYRARKHLKGKSTKDLGLTRVTERNIYIAQKNRLLFNHSLKARKELGYRFIWTQSGNFFSEKTKDPQRSTYQT